MPQFCILINYLYNHQHFKWFGGMKGRSGGPKKEPVSSVNKKSTNSAVNSILGVKCIFYENQSNIMYQVITELSIQAFV